MEHEANERTKLASHLRQYYRETSPTKSYDIRKQQRGRGTIHTPTHNPPPLRLSLRSALKDIISKDWKGLAQHAQPRSPPSLMGFQIRPDPVRMKDSDDYITERAANPRTGLISPSLGTSTPCRESTPNSPGEALKLSHYEHTSPTPDPRRLLFSRANEGRKISAGSNGNQWIHDENEGHNDDVVEERAGTPCSTLPEDRLVMHMPSAKEPQPFAYPGYTSQQIEAYEHYRRKARRVSNEGYDRRLLGNPRIPSPIFNTSDHERSTDKDAYQSCLRQGHHFRPYSGLHERPQPQLVVRKRNSVKPVCQAGNGVPTFADPSGRVAQTKAGIARMKSDTNGFADEHHGLSRTAPRAYCASKLAQQPHMASVKISKQSCMPRTRSVHNVAKSNHDDKSNDPNGRPKADSTVSDMTDLRTLPRVTLVRPEHAAMPVSRCLPPVGDGGRKCSLGCRRDVSSGECLEQRKVSLPAPANRLFSAELPKAKTEAGPVSAEKAEEVLVGILSWVLCYIKGIKMPRSDLVETLRSPDATSKEKAAALKATLSLVGHVLAVGTALAMIWQLSAAVIQLLQIAFWPLAVPFRILRWVMGAS